MDRNAELYGSQVNYRLDAAAATTAAATAEAATAEAATAEAATPSADAPAPPAGPCFDGYRASFPSGHAVTVPQGFDPDELRRLLGLLAESPLR
jgi:membrane-associated phospholipid phosphatase